MRSLIIVRHAEAIPATVGMSDIDRPLSPKGILQAQEMRHHLAPYHHIHVLCSNSRRTRETATHLLNDNTASIEYLPELYNASANQLWLTIEQCSAQSSILVIAHNPGITQLYCELTQQWVSFEPCSMGIIVPFDAENDLTQENKKLLGTFVRPIKNE
jgi:phosphohistidine phosphatase